jgi:hypothetical protein
MNNKEKAIHLAENNLDICFGSKRDYGVTCALEMAQWKDEQLGWHDAKKEQPPMDEEVIVLTNILNGKELSTPRRICFGHIVDKNICVDYDGWNIPGVAYWMYYKEPK